MFSNTRSVCDATPVRKLTSVLCLHLWIPALAFAFVILVPAAAEAPESSHVVLVVLENHSFGAVTNSADRTTFMPWLISQGNVYGFAANYFTNSNGSLLDYLWLASGSCHANPADEDCTLPAGTHSFGCTGVKCASPITDDNIFRQMIAAGVSWKVYAESLPSVGYMGGKTGAYDPSHNAAKWYSDVVNSPAQQKNIVPFAPNFADDLAANRLPRYSIVVPNVLHDAHTGTPAQADSWMQTHLGPLLQQPYFQAGGDGILIITFDNGNNDQAGRVYTAVIGPRVKPDFVSKVAYKHQNTLRTMLDALGITDHPGASASAAPMEDFFLAAPPVPEFSPSNLQFGSQVLNTAVSDTVKLTNAGAGPLAITSIATTAGSDFRQTNDCRQSVAPGASCTVTVIFTPTAVGPRPGKLTFKDSAPGPAQVVELSGTGAAMDFSPSSLAFGGQIVGTSSTQALTVSNPTSAAVAITAVSVNAGFSEANNCATLAPGAQCTVNVTFAPTATGAAIGNVTLSLGGTQTAVPVSGTGTDFSVAVQTGSSPSATVTAGQTATYNLSAMGSPAFNGSIQITCSGAPAGAPCTLNPASVSLSGATPVNFTASIATAARSAAIPAFRPAPWSLLPGSLALGLAALPAVLLLKNSRMRHRKAIAALLLACGLLAGCGGGGGGTGVESPNRGSTGTPAGTYTVVVTASSGSVSRPFSLTLNVN